MMKVLKKILKRALFNRRNNRLLELSWIDAEKVTNTLPKKIENICFVIPKITAYGGGITSILRLGSFLYSFGYKVTYACCEEQSTQSMKAAAKRCLASFKGEMKTVNALNEPFDVVIATDVISMYYAKRVQGYKMAFVQDFEPFFYEAGDYYLIARKAYELGFHMVSLGEWNKRMVKKYIDDSLNLDTISFPYEKKEYQAVDRNYSEYATKKEFDLCVYIRETPRRLPGFCQFIAKNLSEKFSADGMKLNVYFYGENIGKFKYGKNLGKLNKAELFELYKKCDFGMVASYTNISLVPFEMMATGLPIIEFKDGSFETFFDEDVAFLFDFDYDKLYRQILGAIQNPEILIERNEKVQKALSGLSWEDSARQFERILNNLVERS